IDGLNAFAEASESATAVTNHRSYGDLVDVTAEAVGDGNATAILNNGGRPTLRVVRATGRGANAGTGIFNGDGTQARILDAVVHATGGISRAAGVWNQSSSPVLSGATITAEGITA